METLQKLKGKNDTAKVSYLVLSLRRAKAIANLGQVSHTEGPRPVAVRCRGASAYLSSRECWGKEGEVELRVERGSGGRIQD
eukprot:715778-Rhodomonas_salina.2